MKDKSEKMKAYEAFCLENNLPKYEVYLTGDTHIHISKGNGKMGDGVYNTSTLPGDEPVTLKNGLRLTDIKGTCGEHCKDCKGCYAINQVKLHQTKVVPAWGENTLLLRYDRERYFDEIRAFLQRSLVPAFRYHVGGEFIDADHLNRAIALASEFPRTQTYIYTERRDLANALKGNLPECFTINLSAWAHILPKEENPYDYPEFIVDTGEDEEVATLPHCPAVDKDGKETGFTCSMCRHCMYAKKGDKWAVYKHN